MDGWARPVCRNTNMNADVACYSAMVMLGDCGAVPWSWSCVATSMHACMSTQRHQQCTHAAARRASATKQICSVCMLTPLSICTTSSTSSLLTYLGALACGRTGRSRAVECTYADAYACMHCGLVKGRRGGGAGPARPSAAGGLVQRFACMHAWAGWAGQSRLGKGASRGAGSSKCCAGPLKQPLSGCTAIWQQHTVTGPMDERCVCVWDACVCVRVRARAAL